MGRSGMRALLRHLKGGGIVAILHDVDVHDGPALKFFGRRAATSLVTAELALKHNAEIIPLHALRAPISHGSLEAMIRQNLGQWFWIHQRRKPWEGLRGK